MLKPSASSSSVFTQALQETQSTMTAALRALLQDLKGEETFLPEAISYAVLNGGKRIRSFLCLNLGKALKAPEESCIRAACAIEILHSYSLIHDDLPAMDNSPLRRGKPSCHVQFDEATAILAGDAMLAYAFEILSDPSTHPSPDVRCRLVHLLAKVGGPQGMALGQMMDIQAETTVLSADKLDLLHKRKTGLLFEYSCCVPALLSQADPSILEGVRSYGEKVGLLFQIVDDILDAEGTSDQLGKPTGQDEGAFKNTYVSLHGVEQAKKKALSLCDQAIAALTSIGCATDSLTQATHFILSRRI